MNKDEIQKELASAIKLRDLAQGVVDAHIVRVAGLELDLESQLAEKPKLRHGDYGYTPNGYPQAMLKTRDGDKIYGGRLHASAKEDYVDEEVLEVALGNIFDDLTARAEMPDSCSVNINKLSHGIEAEVSTFTGSGAICIRLGESAEDKNYYMKPYNIEDVVRFHRELGGVIANAKKAENKQ